MERHKLRWEDDTVTDLKETGWESMWTGKIQERDEKQAVGNKVMNFLVL